VYEQLQRELPSGAIHAQRIEPPLVTPDLVRRIKRPGYFRCRLR